jgi:hypothetical protein
MRIIKRKDAMSLGLSRYFTGKPCKNGHIAERETKTGRCFGCIAVWNKESSEYIKEYRLDYIKRDGVKEKINNKNYKLRKESQLKAVNSRQRLTLLDIEKITCKDDYGIYKYKISELCKMLGRSISSISNARYRFK